MGELIKTTSEFPLTFSVIGTCGLAGARLVIIVFSWLKLFIQHMLCRSIIWSMTYELDRCER
jgi:hypothetical protein